MRLVRAGFRASSRVWERLGLGLGLGVGVRKDCRAHRGTTLPLATGAKRPVLPSREIDGRQMGDRWEIGFKEAGVA